MCKNLAIASDIAVAVGPSVQVLMFSSRNVTSDENQVIDVRTIQILSPTPKILSN